ncbi:MAG: energy transducer TonB [Candidatus Acidiferrum sp.]
MSIEPGPSPRQDFGSLQGCFVEGSAEQRARERRIRRRALAISIATQCAIVTAIVLIPLFGKPERLAFAMTPIPPYYRSSAPEQPQQTPQTPRHHIAVIGDHLLAPNQIPHRVDPDPGPAPEPPGIPLGPGPGTPCPGCIPLVDTRVQPERPADVRPQPPRRLHVTHLEPAMLLQRVEPVYPPLAIQIHREGRVELHAIIATDGTIQSLQVVNGDPLFLQSALHAVRQWLYRPTVLNGQPVEIDTQITVIYSLQH